MKRVFSTSDQVIHLWANQTQSDARSRNVFFEGKSVYSYGRHYELGRMVEFKGVKIAMINSRGYSVTTAKHIRQAFEAVSHMPRLKTEGSLDAVIPALLERQGELINDMYGHFNRLSFYSGAEFDQYWSYGTYREVTEFNNLCTLLKRKDLIIEIDQHYIDLYNDHVKLRIALNAEREAKFNTPEEIAKREAAKQKRELALIRKAEKSISEWRNGGHLSNDVRNLNHQLIRIKGNEVETSRGASVPLSHALRLLKLIDQGKVKSGDKVGHFSVTGLQGETIRIGCHTIALSEARAVLNNLKPANQGQNHNGEMK